MDSSDESVDGWTVVKVIHDLSQGSTTNDDLLNNIETNLCGSNRSITDYSDCQNVDEKRVKNLTLPDTNEVKVDRTINEHKSDAPIFHESDNLEKYDLSDSCELKKYELNSRSSSSEFDILETSDTIQDNIGIDQFTNNIDTAQSISVIKKTHFETTIDEDVDESFKPNNDVEINRLINIQEMWDNYECSPLSNFGFNEFENDLKLSLIIKNADETIETQIKSNNDIDFSSFSTIKKSETEDSDPDELVMWEADDVVDFKKEKLEFSTNIVTDISTTTKSKSECNDPDELIMWEADDDIEYKNDVLESILSEINCGDEKNDLLLEAKVDPRPKLDIYYDATDPNVIVQKFHEIVRLRKTSERNNRVQQLIDDSTMPPDGDDRVESDITGIDATDDLSDLTNWSVDLGDFHEGRLRRYRHMPNHALDRQLNILAISALIFVLGIAIGHYCGSNFNFRTRSVDATVNQKSDHVSATPVNDPVSVVAAFDLNPKDINNETSSDRSLGLYPIQDEDLEFNQSDLFVKILDYNGQGFTKFDMQGMDMRNIEFRSMGEMDFITGAASLKKQNWYLEKMRKVEEVSNEEKDVSGKKSLEKEYKTSLKKKKVPTATLR